MHLTLNNMDQTWPSPLDDQKVQKKSKKDQEDWKNLTDSPLFRGSLIGGLVTSFITWNTGKHGKIGRFFKYWSLIRYFIEPKKYCSFCPITNYHYAQLDIAANNFYCYSGESGIGKTRHFQNLVTQQSHNRPTFYISFKSMGRQSNFDNEIARQIKYDRELSASGGIMSEIIRAIQEIEWINENATTFRLKYYFWNFSLLAVYALTMTSFTHALLDIQIGFLWPVFIVHYKYVRMMQPLIKQCKRGTMPVIVFDDVNKVQNIGMLAEMTRLFEVLETRSANLMMISSNQETWSKLRREPGMKDRLRVRQINYDSQGTSLKFVELLEARPEIIEKYFARHPLYSADVMKELVRVCIGVKQMSIRRFTSVLKLVDEEKYDLLVEILKNEEGRASSKVVKEILNVIIISEVETMVGHFRSIKRYIPLMSQQTFIETLHAAGKHGKLPSDNRIGSLLKVYNIMRDRRSEYIINGSYIRSIFLAAIQEYSLQVQEITLPLYKESDFMHY